VLARAKGLERIPYSASMCTLFDGDSITQSPAMAGKARTNKRAGVLCRDQVARVEDSGLAAFLAACGTSVGLR
jgi:hypothetical protein